jgi:hypothetical protein
MARDPVRSRATSTAIVVGVEGWATRLVALAITVETAILVMLFGLAQVAGGYAPTLTHVDRPPTGHLRSYSATQRLPWMACARGVWRNGV